jgi:hypothetical protein
MSQESEASRYPHCQRRLSHPIGGAIDWNYF